MWILRLGLLVLTLSGFSDGDLWDLDDVPNPQTDFAGCGRQKASFVCDPKRLLTPQQAATLDWHIAQLSQEAPCLCSTSCIRPFPVSVLFLPHIPSFKQKPRRRRKRLNQPEEFAHFLRHHSWRFGRCSDDAIIIVNTHTGQIHSSLGHVTKHKIKKTCNQRILKTAKRLGGADYTQSVIFILQEYKYILKKKQNICQKDGHLNLNLLSLNLEPLYSAQTGEVRTADPHDEETDHVGIGVNKVVAFVFVPLFGIIFIVALCFYLLRISHTLCCYNADEL